MAGSVFSRPTVWSLDILESSREVVKPSTSLTEHERVGLCNRFVASGSFREPRPSPSMRSRAVLQNHVQSFNNGHVRMKSGNHHANKKWRQTFGPNPDLLVKILHRTSFTSFSISILSSISSKSRCWVFFLEGKTWKTESVAKSAFLVNICGQTRGSRRQENGPRPTGKISSHGTSRSGRDR